MNPGSSTPATDSAAARPAGTAAAPLGRAHATLWSHAHLATCDAQGRVVKNGALVTRAGRIEWLGEAQQLEEAYPPASGEWDTTHDLAGDWVTPGLIDCHTHVVFAGTRAPEYAQRLAGATYEQIAAAGGGIRTTMQAVRQSSHAQLAAVSAPRVAALRREGVLTLEVKSGYGLTLQDEAKMLRVARELGEAFEMRVRCTFLAAHAVPPEYSGRPDDYIAVLTKEWLPALHEQGLVDAVDIFCEPIAFSLEHATRLFDGAQALNLPVKMHAEQLTNMGASLLAARRGALSCDHLEQAGDAEAAALAAAGTVAVLLPLAYYCLQASRPPPVAAFRTHGTAMAVATDCNPGSAPGPSLLLAMHMAVRLFGLTPAEALAGVTRQAARALGLDGQIGTLAPGMAADFVVWRIGALEELGYWIGFNPGNLCVRGGLVSRVSDGL